MKLVSYSARDNQIRPGALLPNNTVLTLGETYRDALSVIAAGLTVVPNSPTLPLDAVRLHAPLANPPRIFAIGLNYRDHAKESGMEIPTTPVVFFKLPTAIVGPGDPILLPRNSTQPDYEAEFAFVIGRGGYRIPASAWRDHVYGYTIVNDVSARDVQFASTQWSMSKCFPTFCPLGPSIVTADEIADPHNLRISLTLNGQTMQDSNTSNLIHKVPFLISYLSQSLTWEPGDILTTGTPSGVGVFRKPPIFLKAGDTVSATVEGLGTLTNKVAGPS